MQVNKRAVLACDVEILHQMRVGLRRSRAAQAMVKDLVKLPEPLATNIDWLAGELGDARNWDVFFESALPSLPITEGYKLALAHVEVAAREEAERRRARMRAAVTSPRYTMLKLTLGGWIAGKGWQHTAPPSDLLE